MIFGADILKIELEGDIIKLKSPDVQTKQENHFIKGEKKHQKLSVHEKNEKSTCGTDTPSKHLEIFEPRITSS
jgi:hypothetical protein